MKIETALNSLYNTLKPQKYELIQTVDGGTKFTVTFDNPMRSIFVIMPMAKDTVRAATSVYAYQGSALVGRLYFAAGTTTTANTMLLRVWDDGGMFANSYCAPSVSSATGSYYTYANYHGIPVGTGITKVSSSVATPDGCTTKIYGIPM